MVGGASNQTLRIVYFGTPAFAVPTLEALLASPHRILAVVTQPDRPSGRGQHLSEGPVKGTARRHGLEVLQPERLKDDVFLEAFQRLGPDLGVVAAYGKILPENLLAIPRLGLINVHASLLPKYRGAAPVHRAIVAGERETGVTIMRIVRALDAGPMLAVAQRPIGDDETSVDVERALATLGADLLMNVVSLIASGRSTEIAQDDREATYAPRLTREDGTIDWTQPAFGLHNLVRGLHPWPHAATYLGATRYLIHRTRVAQPAETATSPPGTVLEAAGDRLLVAAGGDSELQILEIQPEGRRVMTAREFLAGHRLQPGARFTQLPSV